MNIDNAGSPNPATVNAAGATAGAVRLGSNAGQSGTLNVNGGTLAATSLLAGVYGTGTVNITGGGLLSTTGSSTAADSSGSSGTITASGAGSRFNTGSLYVAADANTLGQVTIQNGASLTATSQTILGYFTSTANGTLTVTSGSSASTGVMTIGERGAGTFNLNGGSTATSRSVSIGTNASGTGTANIAGAGTTWTTSTMNVGANGEMTISNGGSVTSQAANTPLPPPAATVSGTATVTGAGSQWNIVGDTTGAGPGNPLGPSQAVLNLAGALTVSDGGKVTIRDNATAANGQYMQLRMGSGSAASLTVTGANSSFTTPFDIWAGFNAGTTANITVSNGGALNTGYTILGASGTGNALVTGAGSVWTISDMPNVPSDQPRGLAIGSASTSKGTLTIGDGGTVNVNATGGSVVIGGAAGSQGTLNIGAAGASPAASPGTLNATNVIFATGATGTINFNHTSNNYVFAPGIQGAGPGTVNFLAGTTILTGNNTYSGATNISAGATAQFGNRGTNGGSNGLISGNVTNNGAMIVNLASLFTSYGGVISGSGTFEQAGTGTLAFTANNTYSGLTKVSSGTLKIGNGGTTGSIAGNVENNSHLAFDRSDNFTFSNLISGTGDVDKTGSGTMTLASVQTYTGGTSVSQGTLRLGGNDRLASTGSLFIFGGATFDLNNYSQTVGAFSSGVGTVAIGSGSLTFGNSLNREFQGILTGTGNLIKQGTGTQIMSGNSSSYTGSTTVNDGSLIVTGNLSNSAATANTGGTLGGTGTVGATTINGTMAPGLTGAIGTLNVNGTYTQAANSFYNVNVNATGGPGASDLVNVTGAANINGGTVRVTAAAGSYDPTAIYTILTSTGARTGTFSNNVTSNFAFLDPTLSYDPNHVFLTLTRNSIDFSSVGQTPNQISAGGGLAALGTSNPIVNAVLTLSPEQARAAFDSVSGEIHPGLRTLMLDESFLVRDAILGRQRQDTRPTSPNGAQDVSITSSFAGKTRKADAPNWPIKAAPADAPVYGTWVQGYGNWTQLNSDGNAATLRSTQGGAIGGFDITLNHNWRFGLAAGGGQSNARVDARLSSATIDTFHIAAYADGSIADIMLRAGAIYSHHDVGTSRIAVFPGFADRTTASYGGSTAQVYGEATWRIMATWGHGEAFANIAHTQVSTEGFTEIGGPAALTVLQADTSTTVTTLGLRGQTPVILAGPWAVSARGSLGWQHAFDAIAPVSLMSFAASPAPFAIAGVPLAPDMFLAEAGLDAQVAKNMRLSLLYSGRLADRANAHALKASLRVLF